jgi:apolipoprotein N-acyltransferase
LGIVFVEVPLGVVTVLFAVVIVEVSFCVVDIDREKRPGVVIMFAVVLWGVGSFVVVLGKRILGIVDKEGDKNLQVEWQEVAIDLFPVDVCFLISHLLLETFHEGIGGDSC